MDYLGTFGQHDEYFHVKQDFCGLELRYVCVYEFFKSYAKWEYWNYCDVALKSVIWLHILHRKVSSWFWWVIIVLYGAAHSHRTIFWSTCQLIKKRETILIDIVCIIFFMTNLIVQVWCNRYTISKIWMWMKLGKSDRAPHCFWCKCCSLNW